MGQNHRQLVLILIQHCTDRIHTAPQLVLRKQYHRHDKFIGATILQALLIPADATMVLESFFLGPVDQNTKTRKWAQICHCLPHSAKSNRNEYIT